MKPALSDSDEETGNNTFIRSATAKPSLYWIKSLAFSGWSSATSLRSHFRATRTNLTPWHFSAISPTHLLSTFSRLSLESTYWKGKKKPTKHVLALNGFKPGNKYDFVFFLHLYTYTETQHYGVRVAIRQ